MAAYFQMGHDTENLVGEVDLGEFTGIVLSPVNRDPSKLEEHVPAFRKKGEYDIILDPQLYYPKIGRGNLTLQPYFPAAFDTMDFSTVEGWAEVVHNLVEFGDRLGVDAIASPVILPTRWDDEFYGACVDVSRLLTEEIGDRGIRVLTTCMVSLSDLDNDSRAMRISSILTRHNTDGFYLVIDSDLEPRREFTDAVGLANLMRLISLLARQGPVLVAYASSDMILYKTAGATSCGTSKFFNLRRFTRSRFDEPPAAGGGQLPYWFEHNLLAFLREADIRRLQRDGFGGLVGGLNSDTASGRAILDHFIANPGEPWLALSWRQYLSWFGKTERIVENSGSAVVREWLKVAEQNWRALDDADVLFDEPRNDGGWIRPWRQALSDYGRA